MHSYIYLCEVIFTFGLREGNRIILLINSFYYNNNQKIKSRFVGYYIIIILSIAICACIFIENVEDACSHIQDQLAKKKQQQKNMSGLRLEKNLFTSTR